MAEASTELHLTDWRVSVPASGGDVLYRPSPLHKVPGASYTRVIRLTQNAAPGHLLTTFECFGLGGFPIYESLDDGLSWSATPVAIIRDTVHPADAWSLDWQPDLFELPQAAGNLPAGTILFAANAIHYGADLLTVVESEIQFYYSQDQGHSWTYRSAIVASPVDGGGVWEPDFALAADGSLVVFYSSERHKDQGYNQLIAHKVSRDGGATWSDPIFDVAVPDGDCRPGMPVVEKLPTGAYIMSYEVCGSANKCAVFVRTSSDGLAWGDASDLGAPVRTASGSVLLATPYVTWTPAGGPLGTVLVTARDQISAGPPARKMFANYRLGQGVWEEFPAPLQWQGGNDHASWSAALLPVRDGSSLLYLVSSQFAPDLNEIRYAITPWPPHTV